MLDGSRAQPLLLAGCECFLSLMQTKVGRYLVSHIHQSLRHWNLADIEIDNTVAKEPLAVPPGHCQGILEPTVEQIWKVKAPS